MGAQRKWQIEIDPKGLQIDSLRVSKRLAAIEWPWKGENCAENCGSYADLWNYLLLRGPRRRGDKFDDLVRVLGP